MNINYVKNSSNVPDLNERYPSGNYRETCKLLFIFIF